MAFWIGNQIGNQQLNWRLISNGIQTPKSYGYCHWSFFKKDYNAMFTAFIYTYVQVTFIQTIFLNHSQNWQPNRPPTGRKTRPYGSFVSFVDESGFRPVFYFPQYELLLMIKVLLVKINIFLSQSESASESATGSWIGNWFFLDLDAMFTAFIWTIVKVTFVQTHLLNRILNRQLNRQPETQSAAESATDNWSTTGKKQASKPLNHQCKPVVFLKNIDAMLTAFVYTNV